MPKVVTIAQRTAATMAEPSSSPYRAHPPVRWQLPPVGPSPRKALLVSLGVLGTLVLGWVHPLVWLGRSLSLVTLALLLLDWARAWRTARLWQRVTYRYVRELPEALPDLDRPFHKIDAAWMDQAAQILHEPEPTPDAQLMQRLRELDATVNALQRRIWEE